MKSLWIWVSLNLLRDDIILFILKPGERYQAHQPVSFVMTATFRSGHAHALELLSPYRRL